MKRWMIILLHFIYWFKFPYFFMSGDAVTGAWMFYIALPTVAQVLAFYTAYFILVPFFLGKRQFIRFGIGSVFTIVGSCLIGWAIFLLSEKTFRPEVLPQVDIHAMVNLVCLSASCNGLFFGSLLKAFVTWYADIRVKEDLKRKNLQTELALLKAQLNPHFLFNTLNNIDHLINKDPAVASAYLNKLSGILRFTLYEANEESVALDKELAHIQQYIDLQRMRTSNEMYIHFEVAGALGNLRIAPMLFIPFIENAFKHSTNKKLAHAVDIRFHITENILDFHCSNAVPEQPALHVPKGGLGMELIKNRLRLLYPDHTLNIDLADNRYSVHLKLKLHDH